MLCLHVNLCEILLCRLLNTYEKFNSMYEEKKLNIEEMAKLCCYMCCCCVVCVSATGNSGFLPAARCAPVMVGTADQKTKKEGNDGKERKTGR